MAGIGRGRPPSLPDGVTYEAIDLLDTAGAPVLKRVAPLAAGVLLLVLVLRRLLR